MSRVRDVLTRRDVGFTIIEVLVSFLVLAIVAVSMVPLLVMTALAASETRYETQAKNLAQLRLEQMRQLAFHVDRQNGPFVDLLDHYYPNLVAASGTGQGWVSESGTRATGEPASGAFYRVVFDPLPEDPDFRQSVATQFLRFDRTAVAQEGFNAYDSQVEGRDTPPSLFLGVTVITTWTANGEARRFETFTQISDPGAPLTLIATQAKATAFRAESTAPDTSTYLTAEAATVLADGRMSDGSSASVTLTAGKASRTNGVPLEAATATALSPGGAQPDSTTATAVSAGACGYAAFGRSTVTRATSTVVDGVPLVPSDVGLAALPANQSQAALMANSGSSCGAFWFDNETTATDPRLQLTAGRPLVSLPSASGSAPVAESRGWLHGTDEDASPRFIRAGAAASTAQPVGLFYTEFTGTEPLVSVRLVSSTIQCDSGAVDPATAEYRLVVDYRRADGTREQLVDRIWSSVSGPFTDPLASTDLTSRIVYTGPQGMLTLADYVDSFRLGTSLAEGDNGIASLDAALRITTKPTRVGDPTSTVGLTFGSLSCFADDNR